VSLETGEGEFESLRSVLSSVFSSPRHLVSNPVGHGRARDYVTREMKDTGLQVHVQKFESVLNYLGSNVSVSLKRL
jgi:hypothetical protein